VTIVLSAVIGISVFCAFNEDPANRIRNSNAVKASSLTFLSVFVMVASAIAEEVAKKFFASCDDFSFPPKI